MIEAKKLISVDEASQDSDVSRDDERSTYAVGSLDIQQQRKLHELCWEFEEALREGKPTDLEQWLNRCGDLKRDWVLAELLTIELEVRCSPRPEANRSNFDIDTKSTNNDITVNSFLQECRNRIPNDLGVVNEVFSRFQQQRALLTAKPVFAETDRRYEFIHELARGGTGAVWRVYDRHLRRQTAVKVLLDSHNNAQMRQRLEQEARLCGRMKHPGIVPIHELSHFDNGTPFVSMKLVEGRTLSELVQSEPCPDQTQLVSILLSACDAVAYAHQQNIIHRDLKPHNIMVGEFNEVQVMDWGLGKDLTKDSPSENDSENNTVVNSEPTQTLVGTVFGTIAYMSPEQARGEIDHVDRRSDVFSLGAILCLILTGKFVYDGDCQSQLLAEARAGLTAGAVLRLNSCKADARLRKLTIDCIAINPLDRPVDASVVASRLRTILKPRISKRPFVVAMLLALVAFLSLEAFSKWSKEAVTPEVSDIVVPESDLLVSEAGIPKATPFNLDQSLALAFRYESEKNYPECERIAREILEHDLTCQIAHEILFKVLNASGKSLESAIVARDAWKKFPNDRDIVKNFVNTIFADGERPENYETWHDALEAMPTDYNLHLEIGWKLYSSTQLADAVNVYREAIRLNPNFFMGYYGLSVVHIKQDQIPEASVAAKKSLELVGDDANMRKALLGILEFCEQAERNNISNAGQVN